MKRRLRLRRAAREELGKTTKNKEVSMETKAKIIQTLVSPIIKHRCESWMVKGADRKKENDSLCIRSWRRALWIPWTIRKMNKWVPEQIRPEPSLEAKMTKQKLPYFEHL